MRVIKLLRTNHVVSPALTGLAIMIFLISEAFALSVCVDPKTGRKEMREGGCGTHKEVSRTRSSTVTERKADEDRAKERRAELDKEACDRFSLDRYMNECATPEEKRVYREEMARRAEERQRIKSEEMNREILLKAEQARQAAEAARQEAEAAKLAAEAARRVSEAARNSADDANQAARRGKNCYAVGNYLHCN